jgi:hypothetical protein
MTAGEGTIEIDTTEFFEWLAQKHAKGLGEVYYGVPRINKQNGTLEVDFAFSTETNPSEWAEKPKAVTQWDELK